MPRVRVTKDGVPFTNDELSQPEAEELHARYFQAINNLGGGMQGQVVVVDGPTHGLPAAWYSGSLGGLELVMP